MPSPEKFVSNACSCAEDATAMFELFPLRGPQLPPDGAYRIPRALLGGRSLPNLPQDLWLQPSPPAVRPPTGGLLSMLAQSDPAMPFDIAGGLLGSLAQPNQTSKGILSSFLTSAAAPGQPVNAAPDSYYWQQQPVQLAGDLTPRRLRPFESDGAGIGFGGGPTTSPSGRLPQVTKPYSRPSHATTPQQRAAAQGKPCVDCGKTAPRMNANHIDPLIEEHYRQGAIDTDKMRSLEAVNPQCPTCSARQGGFLSNFSKSMKRLYGF
jgi:hypothetical protein